MRSYEFATTRSWTRFEDEMRFHFRAETCAGTTMKQLQDMKLQPNQTPADFLQKIQALSLAGAREHPGSYDPALFTRHFFFLGLPTWLQDINGPMKGPHMKALLE